MKYVAFIDTLGFKQKIKSISHQEAVEVIKEFNQMVYNLWNEMNLNSAANSIKGRTFSDSFIIHSQNDTNEELDRILEFLIRLYRISITKSDLPLRGGIAIGNYEDFPGKEFNNLQKGLIVGTAFIDAYLLESSNGIKGSKLLFGQEINLQIERNLNKYNTRKVKTNSEGKDIYELKWGDLIYLIESNYEALNKFIDLGTKSKWLDHYYGTLETFLIKEPDDNKQEIYVRIIERLKSESAIYTKRSFLKFLRTNI